MIATGKLHLLLGKGKHQVRTSWPDDAGIFPPEAKGPQGVLNLSPAWFQQGHGVCCFSV